MITDNVPVVTDATFAAEVLDADTPVVVDFWASWCGPCRVMSPILDEISVARDDLKVVSLDVEANPQVVAEYGVLSMPTFLVFKAGQPVGQLVGSRPKRRLEAELDTILGR